MHGAGGVGLAGAAGMAAARERPSVDDTLRERPGEEGAAEMDDWRGPGEAASSRVSSSLGGKLDEAGRWGDEKSEGVVGRSLR